MPSATTFPQITFKRPLLSVNTVQAALDRDGIAIVRMIEDGSLPWAFNVSTATAGREIRVLAHCVSDFQSGSLSRVRALSFNAVIELIFPMAALSRSLAVAKIKATTVARRFNLQTESVRKLMDAGCLRVMPGTVRKHGGPDGSPEIEFASVVEFLRARRIL